MTMYARLIWVKSIYLRYRASDWYELKRLYCKGDWYELNAFIYDILKVSYMS